MISRFEKILLKEEVSPEELERVSGQLKTSLNPSTLTWLRYFIKSDPRVFWSKVRCPVLALNGEKDLQVSAGENLTAIDRAIRRGGNKSVTVIKLDTGSVRGIPASSVGI
jgi:uncharacterized protein